MAGTASPDTPFVSGPNFQQLTPAQTMVTPNGGNQNNLAALTSTLLNLNTTSTGNGADTTEDTLLSYSLPANTLGTTARGLRITAWGNTAANGDNKTIRLYFGSEVVASPTAATNNKGWWVYMEVYHTAANAQVVFGLGQVDTTAITPLVTTGTETETSAIVIKVTGQAGTGNANDIVAKGLIVEPLY
jgi:hypothetical protein